MTVRPLCLGLDVSPKRLGWGLVDLVSGEPVACGMEPLDLPSRGWHHQQVARALRRVADVALWDSDDPRGEVSICFVEQPALPPVSGTKSAYSAGRAVQAVHGEVERRWPHAPIEYLMPSEWRRLAGLPGNASKTAVMLHAAGLVPIDFLPGADNSLPGTTDLSNVPQDAADALLIAVAGQRRNDETMERAAEIAARGGA